MTERETQLRKFFDEIKDFTYVVQRNWQELPRDFAVLGHGDLDLFATDQDKRRIEAVLQKYPDIPCDVRSPEDNYYPYEINEMLLKGRMGFGGFWIPNPMTAFFALYYHNLIHKQGDPYGFDLEKMFKQMFPPVKCKDAGVGFYGID